MIKLNGKRVTAARYAKALVYSYGAKGARDVCADRAHEFTRRERRLIDEQIDRQVQRVRKFLSL